MYQERETFRDPSNFAEIEGLVNNRDIDVYGFIKITSGMASVSGWYIRVFFQDIFDQSTPQINDNYPELGPLQVIKLNRTGKFKMEGETPHGLWRNFSIISWP